MNTWLMIKDGKYEIIYSLEKPVIADRVIAMVGDAVFEFDPGYAINDTVQLSVISGFKISEKDDELTYFLKDRQGVIKEVHSNHVGHISILTNWLYKIYFNFISKHS